LINENKIGKKAVLALDEKGQLFVYKGHAREYVLLEVDRIQKN